MAAAGLGDLTSDDGNTDGLGTTDTVGGPASSAPGRRARPRDSGWSGCGAIIHRSN